MKRSGIKEVVKMNRKISFVLLLLAAVLIGASGASALPQYAASGQALYGSSFNCGTCHVSPAGGGTLTAYGSMFASQPNHNSEPGTTAALKAIGSPSAASTATSTPTTTSTPTAALTPTATSTPNATFVANLTGSEEVPPVVTLARGNATFNLSNNSTVLQFRVTVANITNATLSHIHLAPPGMNGSIVVNLFTGPTKNGSFNGVLAEGNITQANLTGPLAGQPFSALINNMTNGSTYVNVHTTQHPDGEIRGQIQVAPSLNATSNVTPSATPSKATPSATP